MLKLLWGAQLSEILNEEVVAKESGVSRRRVVAGVAWSVPVIATAIAAPAAAASGVSATAAFDGAGLPIDIVEISAPGQNRTGSGPSGFHIKNNGSAITSSIVGLIRIEPVPAAAGDPGVGVQSLTGATMSSPSLSTNNVFDATFTIPGIASSGTAVVSASFYYKGKKSQIRNFLMTVTVTYPDNTVEHISTEIKLT
jgi:hypothetical protein